VAPGRFRTFGAGGTVVYAEHESADGTLSNVFVQRSRGPRLEVALAARARHELAPDGSSITITLYNGERFVGIPGSAQFRIMRFDVHTVPVEMPPPVIPVSDLDATPTRALVGSHDPAREAELQWRFALPVMGLVLTLVAVPLSRLKPRQGRYARVALAGAVYLAYSSLIALGRNWIERGTLPASFGLWWTHAVVIVAVLVVIGAPRWVARLRHRDSQEIGTPSLTSAT
jgi:lipopolysaccharide export system permease protein